MNLITDSVAAAATATATAVVGGGVSVVLDLLFVV